MIREVAQRRMLDIDAPETSGAECWAEKAIADRAIARLQKLMASGYQLQRTGRKDRTSNRRDLVQLMLADGRDAGQVLMAESLARPWPNKRMRWCGRQRKRQVLLPTVEPQRHGRLLNQQRFSVLGTATTPQGAAPANASSFCRALLGLLISSRLPIIALKADDIL